MNTHYYTLFPLDYIEGVMFSQDMLKQKLWYNFIIQFAVTT